VYDAHDERELLHDVHDERRLHANEPLPHELDDEGMHDKDDALYDEWSNDVPHVLHDEWPNDALYDANELLHVDDE
jgi:hypothetical protein